MSNQDTLFVNRPTGGSGAIRVRLVSNRDKWVILLSTARAIQNWLIYEAVAKSFVIPGMFAPTEESAGEYVRKRKLSYRTLENGVVEGRLGDVLLFEVNQIPNTKL